MIRLSYKRLLSCNINSTYPYFYKVCNITINNRNKKNTTVINNNSKYTNNHNSNNNNIDDNEIELSSVYDVTSEDVRKLIANNELDNNYNNNNDNNNNNNNIDNEHIDSNNNHNINHLSFSVASVRVVNVSILNNPNMKLLNSNNIPNNSSIVKSNNVHENNDIPTIISPSILLDENQRNNLLDSIETSKTYLINREYIPQLFEALNCPPKPHQLINSKSQTLLSLATIAKNTSTLNNPNTQLTVKIADKQLTQLNQDLALINESLQSVKTIKLSELMQQSDDIHMKNTAKSATIEPLPKLRPLTKLEMQLFDAAYNGDLQKIQQILDQHTQHQHYHGIHGINGNSINGKPRINGKSHVNNNDSIDVNIRNPQHGGTPLHQAALAGQNDAIKLLLEYGADINSLAFNNSTPLHWCSGAGHEETVELLLQLGADPTIKSVTWNNNMFGRGSGQTASHWAAESGHVNILKLLHNYSPQSSFSYDERSSTPIDLAKKEAKTAAKNYLQSASTEEYVAIKLSVTFQAQKVIKPNYDNANHKKNNINAKHFK